MNSRAKGKRGELELVKFLADNGLTARRGQQFAGGPGSPDVICDEMPNVHIEVKRTERADCYGWVEQAKRDAVWKMPIVFWRRNDHSWIAVMDGRDMLYLLRESTYVSTNQKELEDGDPA